MIENLEFYYYIFLFFIALMAGFVDSIVGGGGLISVPALLASGINPHLALATNKLQGIFGSFIAVLNYYKFINIKYVSLGIIFSIIGAIIGTNAVLYIKNDNLKFIIFIILTLVFLYTILIKKFGKEKTKAKINIKLFHLIFGLILGFYDGFIGAGAGSFWIFACVYFLGFDIKNASINTKIFNFSSNLASLIIFLYKYEVLWILGIIMAIGQIIGAYFGSKFAIKTNTNLIRKMFLFIVFLTILKVCYDIF